MLLRQNLSGKEEKPESTYLGRVVDLEKGIFFSREREYFTFDINSGEYGKIAEDFEPPTINDKRRLL